MALILGSQSPRRVEILSFFKLPFVQTKPSFNEESVAFEGDPASYATAIAQGKAEELAVLHPNDYVLTADTVVYRNGKVYAKPHDEADAVRMLSELAGGWHSVFTALVLRHGDAEFSQCEETRVCFRTATTEQLRQYVRGVHTADKAGAYAIQGPGGLIVERIEGCYYNVMGLPLNALSQLLSHVGIDLWKHLD